MSALIRGFQIFSGLGTVATTPFAVQFANKHLNRLPSKGERLVSGGPEIPQEKPTPQPETKLQDVMEKAKQIMSKEEGDGEKKCFWWPKVKGKLELLGCFYTNKLNQVFLFHWDYNGRLGLEEKLNQIVNLSKGVKMKFENHQQIQLTSPAKLSFAWLHKWDGEFIPKKHCSITTTGKDKKNYTLICGSQQQEKNNGRPFVNESIDL